MELAGPSANPFLTKIFKQISKYHPWLNAIRIIFDNDGPGQKMPDELKQELRKVSATDIHQELPFMEGDD